MRTSPTPTIALCMIVRDEASVLGRCLEAAAPFVDEICIVDTGSKDETSEIAAAHGARLQSIEWPGSFAKARNVSLEMARSDWILVLDADEVIEAAGADKLRRIAADPTIVAAHLLFTNHYSDGRRLTCWISRFFRSDPRHRFVNPIHEQILPSINITAARERKRIVECDVRVDHYGYLDEVRRDKDKDARNRILFESALEAEPDNAYIHFKYADFLRRFDDDEALLGAWRRARTALETMSEADRRRCTFAAEVHAHLALELTKRGDVVEAGEVLAAARDAGYLPTAMFHWVSGHQALAANDGHAALASFRRCRDLDGRPAHIPAQPGVTSHRAQLGICRALLLLGRPREALDAAVDGSRKWPDARELVHAAAQIEAATGDTKGALTRLMDRLKRAPDDHHAWLIGGEILLELGLLDRAASWTRRALESREPSGAASAHALMGQIDYLMGREHDAATHWRLCANHPMAIAGLGLLTESPMSDSATSAPEVAAQRAVLERRAARLRPAAIAR